MREGQERALGPWKQRWRAGKISDEAPDSSFGTPGLFRQSCLCRRVLRCFSEPLTGFQARIIRSKQDGRLAELLYMRLDWGRFRRILSLADSRFILPPLQVYRTTCKRPSRPFL